VKIDVLYFSGCPHYEPALELVRAVVSDLGLTAEVNEVQIQSPDDVDRLGFLGSPTIHVDGQDIEPSRREDRNFSMSCRRYGDSGVPPREMLERALAERFSR
jgi:hypothetical protein